LATSTGTAKPTPSPPPDEVWICWLTPITRPPPSTSGPPELPGLIAASVWIAPAIWNAVREEMERSTAETTPTESDWRSPNGEPMAATGVPTTTWALEPSGSGRSVRPAGSTSSRAMSASGS
jgi:hypothetical protein